MKFAEERNQGFELLTDASPGVKQVGLAKLTKIVEVLWRALVAVVANGHQPRKGIILFRAPGVPSVV